MRIIFQFVIKSLLWLRYSIKIIGAKQIKSKNRYGMLFLPNHPALIDPLIVTNNLFQKFRARPSIAEDQLENKIVKKLTSVVKPIVIPDLTKGKKDFRGDIERALNKIITVLKNGDNVVVYPAGRIYRSLKEEIGAKSAVDQIIKAIPELQIILVRTTGLWGSSFSRATGKLPQPTKNLKKYLLSLLINGIFFGPRRKVTIDLKDTDDFPYDGDRLEVNKYLENYYNKNAQANTYVPYTWWQGFRSKTVPEPETKIIACDISHVNQDIKLQVIKFFEELSGITTIKPENSIAKDLGLDSLASLEIMAWLESEFGMPQTDIDALQTVGDCMLAASGESVGKKQVAMKPVPQAWYKTKYKESLKIAKGDTVAEVFLNQAKRNRKGLLIADQLAGVKTNQDIVLAIYALKNELAKVPGDRVGIMLPAAVSASIVYMAVMFTGKTPVMINWTVGKSHMEHSMKQAGVTHVLTSKTLVGKLKATGFEYSNVDTNWVFLEEYAKKISIVTKIKALIKSKLSWKSLYKTKISDTAVVLFTSGSEAKPKAVPLSHKNILTNLNDFTTVLELKPHDKMLGMLPPFHSLGLVATIILPLCSGIKAAYHANPTEATTLAKIVDMYKISLLLGTPTFVNGIIRAATTEQLESVRGVVTGAEKCPDYVYDALHHSCPKAVICEGYGITECSPVVSVNHVEDTQAGTIGHVLPSVDYIIVNNETHKKVAYNEQGLLYVKGDSIFNGYLGKDVKSPFVKLDSEMWYNTGDFVKESEKGILTFCGRVKRFIKLGGEMVSLPAIEEVLLKNFQSEDEATVLAIESAPSEDNPEVVLFTTKDITREEANKVIRTKGLSGLHNVRKVVQITQIPVLGTGKTDYKLLKSQLKWIKTETVINDKNNII